MRAIHALSKSCTNRKFGSLRFTLALSIRCMLSINMAPSKKALSENIQKRALKVINGNRHSVKLEKVSSIRNKICALEVFKTLNGASPHAFQNYFVRVKHSQCTRANAKNVVLPKVRSKAGKMTFSFQGAKVFNRLNNEIKTETSILQFKTLCRNFNFDF